MSGQGTSRQSTEDDTDSEENARARRRRPARQGSSRDTSQQTLSAMGGSKGRSRRYRSPEPSTIASPAPTSGGDREAVTARPRRYRSPDRSNSATVITTRGGDSGRGIVGSAAVNPHSSRQNTRAATQGNRPPSSAAPDDVDGELQKGLEASRLDRPSVVPASNDFDPNDLEEIIRKSKEEHEASVKREEEEAEKIYQEHLRYVKADGEVIKVLDAERAALKLRKAKEQEEANVQRMLKESLAAEAERQASAKAKLDALYASFGKSSNDVQSPRPQAVYASQRPSPTPVAPPSRTPSISAVGRITRSGHTPQQPQRSPLVRPNQVPAPSPMRQSTTAYTTPASREPNSFNTTPTSRQPASSHATVTPSPLQRSHTAAATRQPASSHATSTHRPLERSHTTAASRQPNPQTPQQPRRAPTASEPINETDETDPQLLAAIAASNATHLTDQAQRSLFLQPHRSAPVPAQRVPPVVPAQTPEIDEDQFAAALQAALDESLGGAEEADATLIGLKSPPPSYTDIARDRIINHEKYTSAGGPEGSIATLNTTKEVRKIERVKKAQKAAEKAAEERRRGGGEALRVQATVAAPAVQQRPAADAAGPSRSSSSAGNSVSQAEMMRPQIRRGAEPREPDHPPPGLGSVAPGRRRVAPAPWNDAFASIAPRRGA